MAKKTKKPEFTLTVTYKSPIWGPPYSYEINVDIELAIRRKMNGSGFSFVKGERDITFAYKTEKGAANAARKLLNIYKRFGIKKLRTHVGPTPSWRR